jgi:hypothetical protein
VQHDHLSERRTERERERQQQRDHSRPHRKGGKRRPARQMEGPLHGAHEARAVDQRVRDREVFDGIGGELPAFECRRERSKRCERGGGCGA